MSRSFKHKGWIQDQSSKKFGKRFANKKVRRTLGIGSGSEYKKHYQSYDISDYKISTRGSLETFMRRGRKIRKLHKGTRRDNWWWLLDDSDAEGLHRDWMK